MTRVRVLVLSVTFLVWLVACEERRHPDAGDVADVPPPMDVTTDTADAPPPTDALDAPEDVFDVTDAPTPEDVTDVMDVTDAAAGITFVAELRGANEVPPVTTTATGTATVTLNASRSQITYTVTHNVMNATAAHIHIGRPWEATPPAIPLQMTSPTTFMGTATVTAAQVTDLEAGRLYVNVHSTVHTGGEIRGQLLRMGETLYTASLRGTNEVPPVVTSSTGEFMAILSGDHTQLRYEGTFTASGATAAHIHRGAPGTNGEVIYPLDLTGMTLSGTLSFNATRDLGDLNAGNLYVNVHTMTNPGGEIRGQLTRR